MRHLYDLWQFISQSSELEILQGRLEDAVNDPIHDLFDDSRQVQANSVFIAVSGNQLHGNAFIEKAIIQGARCVITDEKPREEILNQLSPTVAIWLVADLVTVLPNLAAWFYNAPSTQLKLIGITGTNGKTSTAFYTAQLLSHLTHESIAMIGTLGNGLVTYDANQTSNPLKVNLDVSPNTTPDVIVLNRVLAKFVAQGIRYCVMEVSSHGIVLNRIAGIVFNAVALTQVTRDHLDFHETEAAYRQAKQKLFEDYPAAYQVLNLDDALGQELYALNDQPSKKIGYAMQVKADLSLLNLKLNAQGMMFDIASQHSKFATHSALMGRFNAENLACAVGLSLVNGFELSAIIDVLPKLQAVTGRMEKVRSLPSVLVDYAHTPDALQQALLAVRQHMAPVETTGQSDQKLWVVFGCGGNRDKGKRPLMGKVSQNFADAVVLTDDNPRCEASYDILSDILQGFNPSKHPQPLMIPDRQTAIETALAQANPQDIILIAGKGHETYQAFCQEQTYFSDQATVLAWKKKDDMDA